MRVAYLAGLLTAALAAHSEQGTSGALGALAGRVVVIENDQPEPVRRARVTVMAAGMPGGPWTTDTDTDGRYRVDGLPIGTVRVRAEKPGFVMPGTGFMRDLGPRIATTSGEVTPADLSMVRGAALAGTVFNEYGQAVENLMVSAVRFGWSVSGQRADPVVETRTDSAGRYRLHTLPAGRYFVRVAADPLSPYEVPRGPDDPPRGVAATYYPSTPRADQALPLVVGPGQDVTRLDVTMTSVPVAAISGRVFDSTGAHPASYTVRMQAVGDAVGDVRGFLRPDGSFFFRGVPPGDYWMTAVTAASETRASEVVVYRLPVSGVDMTGVSLTTAPGRAVAGQIVAREEDALLAAGLSITAHETAFELPTPRGQAPGGRASAGADGVFVFEGLFGPRLLRVSRLPSGWALAAVLVGDVDVVDTPTDFQAVPAGGVRVVLTTDTGTVTGHVRDAAGRPVAGSRVIVFDPDRTEWGPLSRFVRTLESNADGSFFVAGLLPGEYRVVAADWLEQGQWQDPAVLAGLRSGSAVAVTPGGTSTVDLSMGGRR